jgi:GT2 family glycosyltransferase
MDQPDILVIGVIYNTYPETLRYLDSISTSAKEKLTLILVDNSNNPCPPDFLEKIRNYPFLNYIVTGKNLGYFGGAREGLQYYLGMYPQLPQWILVTNVDIVFTESFFLKLNGLKERENLGVIAPAIISDKWNADYNPKILKRYTRRKLKFYRFLYSNFILHNIFIIGTYAKKWVNGLKKTEPITIDNQGLSGMKLYAAHGSCIVLKNTYFLRGGTLDLPNFLFGEEILVAESALQSGLDVEYHPELVIHDHELASVGVFVTRRINSYYNESLQSILKKYYP